ncbi:ATP-dependent endonuclease [Candidatus Pantoea formicae]|uniref:ATP-dependent nuclease n=1 Tax=Candidatus Pantoea formicae TaxID=2608355 RepID=UPI003ED9C8F7
MVTINKLELGNKKLARKKTLDDYSICDLIIQVNDKKRNYSFFKNYITHANFPNFKGIESFARIEFNFPFTAVVGANGIGKSSILHALFGMPEGYSTSKFWFSTALDPITSINKNPPRYVYGHWHDEFKGIVETRKALVKRNTRNYEVWEPTKVNKGDGMVDMPTGQYSRMSTDRWNPVQRNVVYLNLKMVIGAFDRTMHLGGEFDLVKTGQTKKNEDILKGSRRLRRVVDHNVKAWCLGGGRERVFENRMLDENELKHISNILGRDYISAQYIRHSLYPEQESEDVSVIFDRGIKYSEAYAGSGELSIVSIVIKLLSCDDYSLVLLDEPETSLHPGAQKELLRFILMLILKKKLQVVVSTHSMSLIEDLPHEAIKVLESNEENKTRIINGCSPYVALHRLGGGATSKRKIYVEDMMAKIVVERAMKLLDVGDASVFEVSIIEGGAESILKYHIPSLIQISSNDFVYLDGDKKKVQNFTESSSISPSEHDGLDEVLTDNIGCVPMFLINGGNDKEGIRQDAINKKLNYLQWISNRLSYLPLLCPDALILSAMGINDTYQTSQEYKNRLYAESGEKLDSRQLSGIAAHYLNKMDDKNPNLATIVEQLKKWLLVK